MPLLPPGGTYICRTAAPATGGLRWGASCCAGRQRQQRPSHWAAESLCEREVV